MTVPATDVDVIAALAGVDAGSALAELRAQRPEAALHAQGSYAALFHPAASTGLADAERFAVAAYVAELHGADEAVRHYRARLGEAGDAGARYQILRRHAELLARRPQDARPRDLQSLVDAGLSTPDIVTLSQMIAFVAFQVRVVAGLRVLGPTALAAGPIGARQARPPATAPGGRRPGTVIQPPADLRRPT
ncbi:MAG: alkylhydroperoxidase, partial [Chloroflexi bacterium]|nr:alkylhydroperoxidase [Chloroflexota bacterium]